MTATERVSAGKRILPLAACAIWTVLGGGSAAQPAVGFVRLFDGTLNGWVVENTDAGNFRVSDGVLRVEGPNGWLRSERRYLDFALRVEFRFVTPDADSGIFLRTEGNVEFLRGWPDRSYQVQVRNPSTSSKFPPVGGLFRHGMPPGETVLNESAVERQFKGTGAWHTLDIEVADEHLVVLLDDAEVMQAGNINPASGFIGIQGETGAVEYRAINIREQ